VYRVAGITGPDHRRTFHVDVLVEDDVFAQGEGQSIKRAEQEGARNALHRLMAETIDISSPSASDRDKTVSAAPTGDDGG
jgi:dsRNA-specific ribonuclease